MEPTNATLERFSSSKHEIPKKRLYQENTIVRYIDGKSILLRKLCAKIQEKPYVLFLKTND